MAAPARLALPRPTGLFPVGTTELHLVDSGRIDPWSAKPRELMISLWYPAWPSVRPVAQHLEPGVADFYDHNAGQVGVTPGMADFAGTRTHSRVDAPAIPGDRTVIIYSPGGANSRSMGTVLVEDLASRGYLVVTIDHTFTGPVEFPDRFEGLGRGVDNARVMRERAQDTSFSDDWGTFWANSTGWKRDVYLPTAEHMSFADIQILLAQINRGTPLPHDTLTGAIGTIDPQRSIAIQRTYIDAFFALHLRGQRTTLFDKPVHPEVRLIT